MKSKASFIAIALTTAATFGFAGTNVVTVTCNNWQTKNATKQGTVVHYTLTANCNISEEVPNFYKGFPLNVSMIGAGLAIDATYDTNGGASQEVATLTGTLYSTNNGKQPGTQMSMGPVYDNVMTTKSTCKRDPFGTPPSVHADCTPPQRNDSTYRPLTPWPWGGDSVGTGNVNDPSTHIPLQFNGGSLPIFLASHMVDPAAAAKLLVADAETKIDAPKLLSPKPQQHFYSQDIKIQPLIPSTYKQMNQICCQLELQKSAGGGQWMPPLPINKPNVDINNWIIAYTDFAPLGYGFYRLRIAPMKYNQLDATPWSEYVEFGVWPKEVLEVPAFVSPTLNQTFSGPVSIKVKIPAVAKQAGLHCCELEIQTLRNNVWTAFQTQTDTRLDNEQLGVQYDGHAFGAHDVRVRARFVANPSNTQPQWSDWRPFKVQ